MEWREHVLHTAHPLYPDIWTKGEAFFVVVRKQSDERRGWVGGGVGARKGNGR